MSTVPFNLYGRFLTQHKSDFGIISSTVQQERVGSLELEVESLKLESSRIYHLGSVAGIFFFLRDAFFFRETLAH